MRDFAAEIRAHAFQILRTIGEQSHAETATARAPITAEKFARNRRIFFRKSRHIAARSAQKMSQNARLCRRNSRARAANLAHVPARSAPQSHAEPAIARAPIAAKIAGKNIENRGAFGEKDVAKCATSTSKFARARWISCACSARSAPQSNASGSRRRA